MKTDSRSPVEGNPSTKPPHTQKFGHARPLREIRQPNRLTHKNSDTPQRCGTDCLSYSRPALLDTLSASTFTATPSLVVENGHAWLYFVEADGFRTPANLRRAHFKSGQLANFESVQLEGDITAWAWPRVSRSSSGLYGLIMRVKKSVDVAFSNDGVSFGKWEFLAEETGSTPAIAAFSDGRWVIAFQHGPMAKTRSYFRTAFQSEGNQSGWTEQQLVYPESDNVHITMPVVRHDGKIDLYFLTPPGDWHGFAIHRRCLEPDGTLGDVQMVVPYEFGNLLEPHVTRIAPDLLLLTFNEQRIGSHLHAAPLAEDAACPSDNP